MRTVVSVIGSNDNVSEECLAFAQELGKALIDNGYLICTGGRGGVMAAVSKGGRSSEKWNGSQVIAILPSDDKNEANEFVDIAIPTGIGFLRNGLVVRAGEAVIAIAGSSGTMSEISFAWQFEKPVACVSKFGGWSGKLAGTALDFRQVEAIPDLNTIPELIDWLNSLDL